MGLSVGANQYCNANSGSSHASEDRLTDCMSARNEILPLKLFLNQSDNDESPW